MVLIYCIEDINGLKYVGSSILKLKYRFRQHIKDKENDNCCSSKLLDLDNSKIYELEKCKESNRKERESYWINKIECVNIRTLNSNFNNNKYRLDYMKKYNKQNYNNNKNKILLNNLEWRKKNKNYQKEYDLFRRKKVVNGCYEFIQMLNQY